MSGSAEPQRLLVLGGSSEIACAIVEALAHRQPCEVLLAGPSVENLARAARKLAGCADISARTMKLDARDLDAHAGLMADAFTCLGTVDIVILAAGVLGARGGLPDDARAAVGVLEVNLVGAGSLLLHGADRLHAQRHGTLVVLSSVAAERPRRSNAVYGASKAGLDALAQALGDDLRAGGIHTLVVRPGFVHTRMTQGLRAAPLAIMPEAVARATIRGLDAGSHTVWAPPALRWVMLALRLLPRAVFRRLSL